MMTMSDYETASDNNMRGSDEIKNDESLSSQKENKKIDDVEGVTFPLNIQEDEMYQRLIQVSFAKIVNSKHERGGAKLHKNLLVLHLLQKARSEQRRLDIFNDFHFLVFVYSFRLRCVVMKELLILNARPIDSHPQDESTLFKPEIYQNKCYYLSKIFSGFLFCVIW